MWPKIAAYFEMDVAPPLQLSLPVIMADKQPPWDQMTQKYGLKHTYEEVSARPFGDHVFGFDYDFFADLSKIRRAGFHEYVETGKMFTRIFDEFRSAGVIRSPAPWVPPPPSPRRVVPTPSGATPGQISIPAQATLLPILDAGPIRSRPSSCDPSC
jgi:hypothetical protein